MSDAASAVAELPAVRQMRELLLLELLLTRLTGKVVLMRAETPCAELLGCQKYLEAALRMVKARVDFNNVTIGGFIIKELQAAPLPNPATLLDGGEGS